MCQQNQTHHAATQAVLPLSHMVPNTAAGTKPCIRKKQGRQQRGATAAGGTRRGMYGTPFTKETEDEIIKALRPSWIQGLSILGGEPMEPENQKAITPLLVRGNPVMRWMAGNVVVDTDPAGNIKCTKAKSPEKIDGIVAAIMALDRCIRHENQSSVYDERGLMVF